MQRLYPWTLAADGLWAAWIVLTTLPVLDRSGGRLTEAVLGPWLELCRRVTPEAWHAQGNIPQGLLRLLAGMLAGSAALAAAGLATVASLRRRAGASPPTQGAGSRVPSRLPGRIQDRRRLEDPDVRSPRPAGREDRAAKVGASLRAGTRAQAS